MTGRRGGVFLGEVRRERRKRHDDGEEMVFKRDEDVVVVVCVLGFEVDWTTLKWVNGLWVPAGIGTWFPA